MGRCLKLGSYGDDVKALQRGLVRAGYPLPVYGIDGWYGPETERAMLACQEDKMCNGTSLALVEERFIPSGKGMFIQSLNVIDSPGEAVDIVSEVSLDFVIVQAHWQYADKPSQTYNCPEYLGLKQSYGCTEKGAEIIDALKDTGVHVIPFSFPVPGKESEVIDVLTIYADLWDSPSVVIDPERPWKETESKYECADKLSHLMSSRFDSWGMTSYGAPWYHRDFPFLAFSGATYGMPQTYGIKSFGTEASYKRSHDEWTQAGFKHLLSLYGTYNKSPQEMEEMLLAVKSSNPSAMVGWKWGSTSEVEWDMIANMLP